MVEYQARQIQFKELIEVGEWKVKIYAVSIGGNFDHTDFYKNVVNKLPEWLAMKNSFDSRDEKIAFLILHPATEGIFSIINWWVGTNMLNTNIFLTAPEKPNTFTKISGDGLGPCVWELEVMYHEGKSWTQNVLKQPNQPDFESYLKDVINTEI